MKTQRKTRQRRDLTVEKIIEAALDVLKSSDPSALTMRRVAENCGVSAMAIYHHVDDKDQLANMAADSIFLAAAKAERNGANWREKCIDLWSTIRAGLLETPGAGMIWVRQAVLGPGTASATEQMFQLLKEGGLSGSKIAEANDAMTMLTIGSVANDLTRPAKIREKLGEQLAGEDTPLLNENMKTYAHRNGEERYRLALNWILDGVVGR
ncbi:MAG: TetR family transcriptional regulator [Boseongicola sp.]|nr:MAG: TetR family transcriptional regulator [Boseongicola sp.]